VVALLNFVFGGLFFDAAGAGNSGSLLALLLAGGYVWRRVQQQRDINAQQEAEAAEWQRHQEAQAAARESEYQLWQRRTARLEDLYALSPSEFEHAVAELLRRSGWTVVQVVGGPGDMGADITARDLDGLRVIVQAKKYASHHPVGAPTVRLLLGDLTVHRADRGVLVTTSTFTESAQALAHREGIELIDRWRLADMARALDSPERAEWTTPNEQDLPA
jgi:restriction endonuclease Mrr